MSDDFVIQMQIIDGRRTTDDTTVDYLPFGVKVLKLQIRKLAGPPTKIWLRAKNFKRDQQPCLIYGCADDSEDLHVIWGAGDIMGFCAKYAEEAGTKKAVMLDDDAPHVVYLHVVHRPANPLHASLQDHPLTIVAVTTLDDPGALAQLPCDQRIYREQIVSQTTFTLTAPKLDGAVVPDPVRSFWTWGQEVGQISFVGQYVPHYVSRWWPTRLVQYSKADLLPPITLEYARTVDGPTGRIDVWLGADMARRKLAEITGHLTVPLHDLRLVTADLYRFYEERLYALRLTFYWVYESITADDLLAYVPAAEREARRSKAAAEASELMRNKLWLWPGWAGQYEIPDIERFDIVFDPTDLTVKYSCTDAHWREFWCEVDGDQPFHGSISAPTDAGRIVFETMLEKIKSMGSGPLPITNPLEENDLVGTITRESYRYCPRCRTIVKVSTGPLEVCPQCNSPFPLSFAPGFLGKNAPRIENGTLLENGFSSDVLEG